MFPLGFAALAFGLFVVDCAIKKRPVWSTLKEIVTNPTGFRNENAKLDNTTFQEPAPIVSANVGANVGVSGAGPASAAVSYAVAQVGKRYLWAAAGPNAFDCSGLTMEAYKQIGINLPHSSTLQAGYGTAVDSRDQSQWLPGDLLFPHPGHVAMYVGPGKEVEAMNPTDGIRVNTPASTYWRVRRIVGGSAAVTSANSGLLS